MQSEEQPESGGRSAFRDLIETVLFTLLIYFLVRFFLFENYRVVGHSMDPTLSHEQFLVVNKLSYRIGEPQRGDIVVFEDPHDPTRKLIKRVIGLPGEVVEIQHGAVFINGQKLHEPYIDDPGYYSVAAYTLSEGQYYVLGDNRNNSSDSHSWGALNGDAIVGKAWLSYWPPQLWGIVPQEAYGSLQ
jgi:signal peptidase I